MRKFLPLLLVAAAVMTPVTTVAETLVSLKPLTLTLPDNNAPYPPGPGVEVANNNCLACHSVEMVLNQPGMPKAAWQAEVAKMRNVYMAPIVESDVPAIVDYLTAVKGVK
jgi:cytochrome c5